MPGGVFTCLPSPLQHLDRAIPHHFLRRFRPCMKRCWIHIGMPKTGSTSIQNNLAKAERNPTWRLLKVGGSSNMNLALVAMFASNDVVRKKFGKRGRTRKDAAEIGETLRKRLRRVIKRTDVENLIISGEVGSRIDEPGIIALKEFLTPLVDEIRVIGYVRPPFGYK